MKTFVLCSCLLLQTHMELWAQSLSKINQYAIGIAVDVGHSFPNFDRVQNRWKGTFYPSGGIAVLFSNRVHQHWIVEAGLGITGYALTNKGRTDSYILDFASPLITSGISYHQSKSLGHENFIRLSGGVQLGYRGTLVDVFDTYSVTIQGEQQWYPFIRPEIGIRRSFGQKMKGSRFKMAYELGTFFRYNLDALGTATITENDFQVILQPSGHIMGTYFKILFPVGKKRMSQKPPKEKALPPIIYNPRYS